MTEKVLNYNCFKNISTSKMLKGHYAKNKCFRETGSCPRRTFKMFKGHYAENKCFIETGSCPRRTFKMFKGHYAENKCFRETGSCPRRTKALTMSWVGSLCVTGSFAPIKTQYF